MGLFSVHAPTNWQGRPTLLMLSAPETLLKTTLKIDTPGIFVPWHFTIFWQNLQHVGGWTVNSLAEKNRELRDMKSTIEQARRANSQFKIEGSYFPEF